MMQLQRLRAALGGLLLLALAAGARALPPEIEADRLALQAKSSLDAKDYAAADAALTRLQALGVALPDQFFYLRGVAANGIGKYKRAMTSLEEYLKRTGKTGKYYQPALSTYSQAEESWNRMEEDVKAAQARWDAQKAENQAALDTCREENPYNRHDCWRDDGERSRELGDRPELPNLD